MGQRPDERDLTSSSGSDMPVTTSDPTGSGPGQTRRRAPRVAADSPHYRWVALSNTTLGMLMATINSSIVLISLPAIFRGIHLDPLAPGNVSYLLWMLMGFLLVTAVLVVSLGRLGDIYGRVRIYSLGFVVFTVASVALSIDPLSSSSGALWLILWRVVQGVGAAMIFANSTARPSGAAWRSASTRSPRSPGRSSG
jgi:MFS family permease